METQANVNGGLFKRIALVMADIRSLPKDGTNTQSNYKYVSSDTALDRIGKAMAAHGVVIIPMMLGYDSEDVQRGNSVRTRVKAQFQMHICDSDGNAFLCPWFAEGIDYGSPDRALNKAMTNATKYFLLKLFVVGAGGEDPDGETVEDAAPPAQAKPTKAQAPAANGSGHKPPAASEKQVKMLHSLGRRVYGDQWDTKRPQLSKAASKGATEHSEELTSAQISELISGLDNLLKASKTAKPE